jgi:hypothetical protein
MSATADHPAFAQSVLRHLQTLLNKAPLALAPQLLEASFKQLLFRLETKSNFGLLIQTFLMQ